MVAFVNVLEHRQLANAQRIHEQTSGEGLDGRVSPSIPPNIATVRNGSQKPLNLRPQKEGHFADVEVVVELHANA